MRSPHTSHVSDSMHRCGFSLIEVIIATAILLGSVVVLARLAGLGRIHAQNTAGLAQAQRICENTLNEIMLGHRPLFPVESTPLLPLDPDGHRSESTEQVLRPGEPQDQLAGNNSSVRWLHSVRLEPSEGMPGLSVLTVDITEAHPSSDRGIRYSLTRWIRKASPIEPIDDSNADGQLFGGIIR
ncbi:MAG: type II secretion system GspH family protein [Fuerstiella sp.]|nr:type II secretion system GspH family protein [Fuerstiella sp.]